MPENLWRIELSEEQKASVQGVNQAPYNTQFTIQDLKAVKSPYWEKLFGGTVPPNKT